MNKHITIDGQKFKLVPHETGYLLNPITPAKEEKDSWILAFQRGKGDKDLIYNPDFQLTEPQAQAIADAIEALLEYVQAPSTVGTSLPCTASQLLADSSALAQLQGKAMEARRAMHE